ncbi:hypothetical protein K504DRAFT_6049 [Pleomassaria siparia CBS 279.74]|uniref:Uncharacterized protein n=1 Tax=Pleomassaria siparia CBS 279.74 TaxID=1314801 RepID=A0A6G1KPT0_9PLEO|nr:hypothetical protein K504DRAFT_6049 [Pleomassaria siparia CBS 279.74]
MRCTRPCSACHTHRAWVAGSSYAEQVLTRVVDRGPGLVHWLGGIHGRAKYCRPARWMRKKRAVSVLGGRKKQIYVLSNRTVARRRRRCPELYIHIYIYIYIDIYVYILLTVDSATDPLGCEMRMRGCGRCSIQAEPLPPPRSPRLHRVAIMVRGTGVLGWCGHHPGDP